MSGLLITGGGGFLGKHVMKKFYSYDKNQSNKHNIGVIHAPGSRKLDLTNQSSVLDYFDKFRPDIVLHMAAECGGIGLNKKCPADLTHNNLKMAVNLFDAINKYDIKQVYTLGSVCSYPENCPVPFKEDDIWNGYPERTNAGYGFSKKALLMLQKEYRKQYQLKGAHLVIVNMYGPEDHFDLENSHVIPALINKFVTAINECQDKVECWGTGAATREFLYVEDAAEAIIKAVMTGLDYDGPINIGTGRDISIMDLANLIADLTEFDGKIVFTGDVSDGQPKRMLDVSRAKEVLDWEAKVALRDGLVKTIQWYKDRMKR